MLRLEFSSAEQRQLSYRAAQRLQSLPERLLAHAQRGNHAQAGDDSPAGIRGCSGKAHPLKITNLRNTKFTMNEVMMNANVASVEGVWKCPTR